MRFRTLTVAATAELIAGPITAYATLIAMMLGAPREGQRQ